MKPLRPIARPITIGEPATLLCGAANTLAAAAAAETRTAAAMQSRFILPPPDPDSSRATSVAGRGGSILSVQGRFCQPRRPPWIHGAGSAREREHALERTLDRHEHGQVDPGRAVRVE